MNGNFRREILSEVPEARNCFQCGVCSGACPVAFAMDYTPREILRMVNLGIEKAIESSAIWLCTSCYLCTERCPMRIDVVKVMLTLRRISLNRKIAKGIESKPVIAAIDSELCSNCRLCIRICSYAAIEFDEERQSIRILDNLCRGCGLCVAACPAEAIEQEGFTRKEISAEIKRLLSVNI